MAKVRWLWTIVLVCQGLGFTISYGRNALNVKNDLNETELTLNVKSAEDDDSLFINTNSRLNPLPNTGFIPQTFTDFKRTVDAYLTPVPKSHNDSREYLLNNARKIGYHLREISNEELGVTAMQAAFDNSQFPPTYTEPSEEVKKISKRLRDKMERYLNILNKNKMAVESLHQHHLENPLTEINQCCKMSFLNLKYDDHFGIPISKDSTCDSFSGTHPLSLPYDAFLPGVNLSKVFKQNLQDNPSLKWQYFISTTGVHSEFPAYNLETELGCKLETDARHRNVYFRTVQPYTKHVVIVIDHGNSMSPFQLATAKTIGKYILSSLSHHDKVGLIGLAAEAQFPQSGGCHAQQMAHATYETKYQFSRFIDGLQKTSDGVNHLMGFRKAFKMIQNTLDFSSNSTNINSEALIVYISRGLLSSIADAKVIMENIAHENYKTLNRVIINTYTILEEGKPVTFEKTFLQDVAEQNYKQYHISDIASERKIKPGVMVAVNSSDNITTMIGNFLSVLSSEYNPTIHFSLPHWDSIGKGLVVSITQPVYGSCLLGVVGIDIPVADLADGVTYYGHLPHSYAFLIEETGVAIMHPSFPRPAYTSGQPMHTDIWHLEQRGDTRRIKRDIIKQTFGEEKVPTNSSNTPLWRYGFHVESNESLLLQYNWHKVEGTPYTVCIVTSMRKDWKKGKLGKGSHRPAVFTYHRLDLIPPPTSVKLCKHLKQLSTTEVSTIFLSASTFESPFEYLLKDETPEMADRYLSYLHDMTGTITNPGLKESVRKDVLTVAIITDHWKKKLDNEFSKYTVRKFVATQGGVFLTYPGTVIDKTYDPTKREWFTRAIEFPGRVIVSAPYLDVGGGGYIVTISSVILEGKYASMHSTSDPVTAVIGMDLTLGYFYKIITEVISICQDDRITCFLLDDRGYLISHPSFIEPNSRATAEQQHITHKEPLVAGDILNHKYFAEKKLCNSFSDRTIQRFYQFNTSFPFLTNLVQGESCAKYMMTPVSGTNIFVGIVNQTCQDVITTFCPCSTTDRLCLNCHRMEQTECECPCECPLEVNLCSGQLMDENDNNPSCPRFPEEPHVPAIEMNIMENLDLCFASKCHDRKTKNDCFGVLGCEWCQLEADGFTSLKKEFCTEQRKCFGGVLGARTPYADEIIGLPEEDYFSINNTPVGPVAGGIISCFLVFAFAVYCYRSHINRGGSTEYIASPPDGNVHPSQMENDIDEPDLNDDHVYRAACSNIVLASFDNAAVISPYRFAATGRYRRPGGDSDPGYSTMTPHDESENVPYIEPLLMGKDRSRAPASQLSVSSCSRASSPSTYNPNATTPPESGGLINTGGTVPPVRSCNSPVFTNVPHHNWGQMFSRDLTQTVIPEVQVHAQVHMADTC